jgi:Fe2+ transport system protein FeoA
MKRSLLNLTPGQKGVISAHHSTGAVRQRLLDLGLIPAVEVKFVRAAPLGDPIQVKAGSASVILRRSEAETVIIR